MELQQYLQIVRRYWRSTLATVLLCIGLAAGFTLLQSPTYAATSSVFLSVEGGATAGELTQGVTYAERQVGSYVAVATTALVLQPVIDELDLQESVQQLESRLTVSSPAATSLIEVTARASSPQGAADLSNAVAESLQRSTEKLTPPGPGGTKLVNATVIDMALAPLAPTAPRPMANILLGSMLGILSGVGQALIRGLVDTRIRTITELAQVTDASLLATIEHHDSKDASRSARVSDDRWANAEAYRKLRTSIGFVGLGGQRRHSMVITSSVAGEGKTETAINLARVLALAGEQVLLIDADLRRPQVAARLGLDRQLGLSDVLKGRSSLQDLTIDLAPGSLSVLPAGTIPPNPSELLGSEAMARVLATVERQYDHVILDSPPLLPVTDAVVLAAGSGGAIVVSRAGFTRRQQLAAALDLVKSADATLLGVVLNDTTPSSAELYRNYYNSREASRVATAE